MALLGVDELLRYAIRIEENGEVFYRHWAHLAENQNREKVFNFLADEENDHKKTFEGLMKQVIKMGFQPEGVDNKEYEDLLEIVSKEVLFNEKQYEKEINEITDLISIIDIALKLELDSIIFYTDLKKFIPREHLEIMERIITEEQDHYKTLEEFKEKLLCSGAK